MLRKTDTVWFSRLLRHPARKRSGSILTSPEPERGRLFKTISRSCMQQMFAQM